MVHLEMEDAMSVAQDIADRYVAVWNETDAERRRQAIAALWVPDGLHHVGTREARGYAALDARITGSHEKNVRDAGNRFRASKDARMLRDAVTFQWVMLPADSEAVLATGLEVLIVDEQRLIRADYQFIVS
jgi:hypothetical protein